MATEKKKKKKRSLEEPEDEERKKVKVENSIESFEGLSRETKDILLKSGKSVLFPIQVKVWSAIYEKKQDVLARAKTGTGKTLAFALPIVETLDRKASKPGALVLAPTRELAQQVEKEFSNFPLRTLCCYGGSAYGPQCDALRRGVHVVVGTPGRIKDLIEKSVLKVDSLSFAVLDEADQMLDMGFGEEIEMIFKQCSFQQLLLFSATVPQWVERAASKFSTKTIQRIDLVSMNEATSNKDIEHVCVPAHWQQVHSVVDDLCQSAERALIFCETKVECNEMMESRELTIPRRVLHGDVAQKEREKTIEAFKKGTVKLLVATDVAARGLDLTVDLVVMNKPPTSRSGRADVETYTHRSGRTGRAGRKGTCITLYSPRQRDALLHIESAMRTKFEWRGAPRPGDVLNQKALKAVEDVKEVDDDVVSHFAEAAESFGDDMKGALAKALARLAGYTQAPKPRSLFNNDDYVTCSFTASTPISHSSYVWNALRRVFEDTNQIKSLRLFLDNTGAVFDVPSNQVYLLKDQKTFDTDLPKLPELKPLFAPSAARNRGGGRGGGYYGRGGRGGYYNNNNSRSSMMRGGRRSSYY